MESYSATQEAYREWIIRRARTNELQMKEAAAKRDEKDAHELWQERQRLHLGLHKAMLVETAFSHVNPDDAPLTPDMRDAAETILQTAAASASDHADPDAEDDPLPVKYRVYIVADERPSAPNDKPLVAMPFPGQNPVPDGWSLTVDSAVAFARYVHKDKIKKGRLWGVDISADSSVCKIHMGPPYGEVDARFECGEPWPSDIAGQPTKLMEDNESNAAAANDKA